MGASILSLHFWLTVGLFLSLNADIVSSRPSPDPKAAWIRKGRQRQGYINNQKREVNNTTCAADTAKAATAPKSNIWGGLTNYEAASVAKWLFAQEALNITASENATEWDNTMYVIVRVNKALLTLDSLLIELMLPNKTDALGYIDGNGTAPGRYAHVVLDHRATDDPYYADLLVGPLPVNNFTTKYEALTYPYTKKAGGRVRNLDADGDDTLYSQWIYKISDSIKDITLDLWGGTALGLDNDTLDIWGIDPLWQDNDRIVRWDQFWNYPTDKMDTETLLPLGLYFKSDVTGRDPSKWKLEGWLYNDIFYNTTREFREAYYFKGFEKLPANTEGKWGSTDQQGSIPPLDQLYPPTMIAPAGSRYSVDKEEKYIKWMDFEFYLGYTRDTGMHLYNIKYKGQRIIYELGLQEALAHYAGNDPIQSGTAYLDSFYGFGPYSFELVKGYDCPAYATYLNSSFYTAETTHTHLDSICLFEQDAGFPIQRHSTDAYVSVTKNVYFTIRNVCTVGNYDYMFSYEFYMNGSIHVSVRASGYIQSAYFANNHEYGYQIHDALSGSMHDHVLNYKVDFDVLGTENTMLKTTPVAVSEVYPWSNGKARNTMKLQREIVETEDSSKLFWGQNSATQFTIVNKDKPNKYGEYRGFRVLPSQGTIHLTVQNSSNLVNAANWANYDLMVTKQHDYEPRSAHPYNSQDVHDPPVDFAKFFNGENLTQTDLVLWFNLGMHHVFTTAHSGLQIMPLNYLLGDPSRETVNQVRINYNDGNVSKVIEFGQEKLTCEFDFGATEPDLYDYKGDVVIRKFPYDPNDPYYETDSIVYQENHGAAMSRRATVSRRPLHQDSSSFRGNDLSPSQSSTSTSSSTSNFKPRRVGSSSHSPFNYLGQTRNQVAMTLIFTALVLTFLVLYLNTADGTADHPPTVPNRQGGHLESNSGAGGGKLIAGCPDYKHYSAFQHRPFSTGPLGLPWQRPSPHCRTFSSPLVEKVIEDMEGQMIDKDLARLFANAFPNTLDTTVRWHVDGVKAMSQFPKFTFGHKDAGKWEGPQSFIVTGDINAEWLRDSTNQLAQYQTLAKKDKSLENLILGAINTQAEYVIESPYCNAFQPPPPSRLAHTSNGQEDTVHPAYEPSFVFECKYELDSLAHFLALGNQFHKTTGSKAFLTNRWYTALNTVLEVLDKQAMPTFSEETSSYVKNEYTFTRKTDRGTETLSLDGIGNPLNNGTGLIRSAFRPSDDTTILGFFIPANAMMAVELKRAAEILKDVGKTTLANELTSRGEKIEAGVWEYGVVSHAKYGKVFAYEVDGYGSSIMMDDANLPSLLALPLLGFVETTNPVYQNTRKMILNKWGNPYYLQGKAFHGIGGPHIGMQHAWPMSLLVQAMTSNDDAEILECVNLVKNSSHLGLVHESVNVNRPSEYTRSWFAWANSVFAQTILDLASRKPELLFGKGSAPYVIQ
ncbi:MAG: hypothetical protein M1834_007051 [Cirrosporium novae-zelandiae]|nr:MAG: hypothetical protein M1834_007051 [Cirrosporium novae-zelandiae]